MKITLKYLFILLGITLTQNLFAQAPNITYDAAATTLTGSIPFLISPTNTGGAVPATIYGQVTTIAGQLANSQGYLNGDAATAKFYGLRSIVGDAAGNLYVADGGNNAIRMISPAGVVSTFAGSATGAAGFTDATGTSALFKYPIALAIDASGNLFVSDYLNNAIRKITPAGAVSTFYSTAGPFGPWGICFDGAGNLIVATYTASQIIKITPAGVATVIAGTNGVRGYVNGPGTSAQFNFPNDVMVDASGNVLVADRMNNAIRKIAPDGTVSTFAGSSVSGNLGSLADGTLTTARFSEPYSIVIDKTGVMYVADRGNGVVRRVMPDGTVSVVAGRASQLWGTDDGVSAVALVHGFDSIYIDDTLTAYIVDGSDKVAKIVLTGYSLTGTLPAGLRFNYLTGVISGVPAGISAPLTVTVTAFNTSGYSAAAITFLPGSPLQAPNISYGTATANVQAGIPVSLHLTNTGGIVDTAAYGQVTTLAGSVTAEAGYLDGPSTTALFNWPQPLVKDASGNLYVTDATNNVIRKVTPEGVVTTFAGSTAGVSGFTDATGTSALFKFPDGIAMDASGNMFVGDYGNKAIREITPAGVVTTFYSAADFGPDGMSFDSAGNLIVADQDMSRIIKISPAGVATTIAGNTAGYVNGTSAAFNEPTDVQVDATGNLYVADYLNNAIRKITPAGVTTTLAGSDVDGNVGGYADGVGTAAVFNQPSGVAIGPGGTIYVMDMYNNDIRKIMPDGKVVLVAGSTVQATGNTDGKGTGAKFNLPVYLYLDDNGLGYVTELGGNRVRKILLTGYAINGMLPAGLAFDEATGTISGTVTAPFATQTYTVTACNGVGHSSTTIVLSYYVPSTIATLSNLVPSSGTLSPAFAATTTAYADTVSNSISSITLTPTTTDSNATVTVNGTAVTSGTASGDIPLTLGDNTITVVVTAQDGVTTDTYTLNVYRGATMASLAATNLLTPNGDGKNDQLLIKDIQLYPQNTVTVYDKSGRVIYTKHGYNNDWDGTSKGSPLSVGTYYYVVDLGPNLRKIKGYISILRN
ncbi:MAG TPA: gliding motility-associated C-terminal domain-containing protein [Mucilaginibacter sp.]|nr:gliding motility-associated C-terminal domain-containing protein [Mucilaginibacter sp.]